MSSSAAARASSPSLNSPSLAAVAVASVEPGEVEGADPLTDAIVAPTTSPVIPRLHSTAVVAPARRIERLICAEP